jgi:hypothetical protein
VCITTVCSAKVNVFHVLEMLLEEVCVRIVVLLSLVVFSALVFTQLKICFLFDVI